MAEMMVFKMELSEGTKVIFNKESDPPFMIVSIDCVEDEEELIETVNNLNSKQGIIYMEVKP
jgi:hypothetical protein